MSKAANTLEIEIFRPGSFRAMEAEDVAFSAGDLATIARRYDTANDAPIVIGHPDTDAPAYGWVKALRYDGAGKRLFARIGDLHPAFAAAVRKRHYKKVSASFFAPDSPANPKPGAWYLRHVGFLGAAAPAVSGLRPVDFAGSVAGIFTFNFSEKTMSAYERMKAFLVGKVGQDQADTLLSEYDLAALAAEEQAEQATEVLSDDDGEPSTDAEGEASEDDLEDDGEGDGEEGDEEGKNRSFAERQLRRREVRIAGREKRLRRAAKQLIHRDNLNFAEGMVRGGRLLPVHKARLVAALDEIASKPGKVSFADGSSRHPAKEIKAILASLPASVSFGSTMPAVARKGKGVASFAAPDNFEIDPDRLELHKKALAYQREHPDVDYATAISIVEKED